MIDHLLESSRRDDSNKWSNIGFGIEIMQAVSIKVNYMNLIWSSVVGQGWLGHLYTYSEILHQHVFDRSVDCTDRCTITRNLVTQYNTCLSVTFDLPGLQIRDIYFFLECLFLHQILCLTTC